jgi:hypothetical protein
MYSFESYLNIVARKDDRELLRYILDDHIYLPYKLDAVKEAAKQGWVAGFVAVLGSNEFPYLQKDVKTAINEGMPHAILACAAKGDIVSMKRAAERQEFQNTEPWLQKRINAWVVALERRQALERKSKELLVGKNSQDKVCGQTLSAFVNYQIYKYKNKPRTTPRARRVLF